MGSVPPSDFRPKTTARSKTNRSRVTNGKLLPRGVDGRSAGARRFRDLCDELTPKKPTVVSTALVRSAAMLACKLEDMEAADLAGKSIDAEKYATISGTYARILDRLGLTENDDEPERPPIKIPPGWWTEEMRQAYDACETHEQRRDWYCSLPREKHNEVAVFSGLPPIPEPEPYRPYVPPPPYEYRPPEGAELEELRRMNAKQIEAEREAADPWNSVEARAARRELEKIL